MAPYGVAPTFLFPPLGPWEPLKAWNGDGVRITLASGALVTSTAERKLGTHFELASGPSHLPDGPARPLGNGVRTFAVLY
jgi:hypothetical protein